MKKQAFLLVFMSLVIGLGVMGEAGPRGLMQSANSLQLPGRFAGKGIVVGLEYVIMNNPRIVHAMAEALSETGMTGIKHLAEAIQWDAMQKGAGQPIDFSVADLYVSEYQQYGFTELTLCLKPHSHWGSKNVPRIGKYTNTAPKPEYQEQFANWIHSVVERYDGDGVNDMPGLRWPVRYIEIGSEFSSYQPEPVGEYLDTLRLAYQAAHRAASKVMIGHSPFLITPVNLDVKNPRDYERVWATTKIMDRHHDLKDQRVILDHPELFDFINIHNLGDPYEIEDIVRWLKYETGQRGYTKPVVVSDTCPTSFIGWGPATTCRGPKLGVIGRPATEADRCRLADFFTKLTNKDAETLAWARGFIAADQVQRTIIAAEQGITLINLSFTGDLPLATWPIFKAAAGLSAWGGALHANIGQGEILEKYPLFYAIKQMMGHFNAYDSIERINLLDDQARVYFVQKGGQKFWIAWRNPKALLLPEDGQPSTNLTLHTGTSSVMVEPVIIGIGQTTPQKQRVETQNGMANLALTNTPVYIFPQ